MDRDKLRDFAINAQEMINAGNVEDRLRHYLSSRLPSIFPETPWWVQAHVQGTEEQVRFGSEHGDRYGFVDNVVGKTAVEYEKNLNIQSVFNEGYHQVEEYCAALYNIGVPENEILGVLSDTVRWYGYRIHITGTVQEGHLYGPNNVELEQISFVDLSRNSENEFTRFEQFINQFMAREGSRFLNANTLVTDFGVESSFYREYIELFTTMVERAMESKPEYADLIKQVWQNFVAYLGVSDYGSFSVATYISEFYLVTVAKIICANIMAGRAIISNNNELADILNGTYFTRHNITNLIDYDYFGWLNDSPYIDQILPCAAEIQNRLRAYDFSKLADQDIFGKLLAQLANREHRLMLGQEFTPHWVAKDIVEYNLSQIDEDPHILDMCCGSGVFLIEAIKAIRRQYEIEANNYTAEKDSIIFSSVMGFDIDPLAVMLAKVNWIISMRDLFQVHTGSINIPIYHADSLFIATPITHHMPTGNDDYYVLNLDGHEIRLPSFLLSSAYRKTFDSLISKVYRLAMTRANTPVALTGAINTASLINAVKDESETVLSETDLNKLEASAAQMVEALECLQREGRNGIWHFIISNSYRPGLTGQQFNCLVSNPPWMAMSKLADNPYRESLSSIARRFAIQPMGAAHPHMELGTIFLVSSVKRYLKNGAHWSCIMPASLLSGLNHEAFRNERYKQSDARLNMNISAIWELPTDTFKNKAIVLSGDKDDRAESTLLSGRTYSVASKYDECTYTLNRQGRRTAWTNRGHGAEVVDVLDNGGASFMQGCDLFPRDTIFHQFYLRPNGNVNIAPIDRDSDIWYLVSDLKKQSCGALEAEDFDKEYIYDAFISKHLSPFIMAEPVKAIVPGKKELGCWKPILASDFALMNPSTAYVFRQIAEANNIDLASYLLDKINIYGKLFQQNFAASNWLVLSSASGANPCAAYISLSDIDRSRLVIDQTLYWCLVSSEAEALFITGLLNSSALARAIADFQPEGGFGKRHIHTLPYKIIPRFDPDDDSHVRVAVSTKSLIDEWKTECEQGDIGRYLDPNSTSLNARRRRQQAFIKTLCSYDSYDFACSAIIQ